MSASVNIFSVISVVIKVLSGKKNSLFSCEMHDRKPSSRNVKILLFSKLNHSVRRKA